MNKKTVSSVLALIVVAAMMLCGCGKADVEAYEQQIAALQQENAALKDQVQVLTRQLENIQSAVLTDWSLTALASAERNSATLTFTAVPASRPEGQTVYFVVRLNDFEAESIQCTPEEDRYTATVTLPAADGYSYFCLITSPSGIQQEIPLVTLDTGNDAHLINLSASLTGYGNLIVEEWEAKDEKLTIKTGYVQAQLPLISTGGDDVKLKGAALVLMLNGEEVERREITLSAGEGENTYEAVVSGEVFDIPEMEDDHQLDLVLEINLSSGDPLTNSSCSWYYINGELTMVVG